PRDASGIEPREVEFDSVAGRILEEQLHLACQRHARHFVADAVTRKPGLKCCTSSAIEGRVIEGRAGYDRAHFVGSTFAQVQDVLRSCVEPVAEALECRSVAGL